MGNNKKIKMESWRNKDDWKKQTYDWYAIPFMAHIPRNNVDKSRGDKCSLRYCKKCDIVYETTWVGGRCRYYRLYIRKNFPKRQKEKICPRCAGKDCKILNE